MNPATLRAHPGRCASLRIMGRFTPSALEVRVERPIKSFTLRTTPSRSFARRRSMAENEGGGARREFS